MPCGNAIFDTNTVSKFAVLDFSNDWHNVTQRRHGKVRTRS